MVYRIFITTNSKLNIRLDTRTHTTTWCCAGGIGSTVSYTVTCWHYCPCLCVAVKAVKPGELLPRCASPSTDVWARTAGVLKRPGAHVPLVSARVDCIDADVPILRVRAARSGSPSAKRYNINTYRWSSVSAVLVWICG